MRRVLQSAAVAAIVLAGPTALLPAAAAVGTEVPPAVPFATMQNARSFQIRNWSGQTITQATALMTDRKTRDLTHGGPIHPGGAANIVVPKSECLAAVQVKFDDGRSMALNRLNDCRVTNIIVRSDRVELHTNAAPGYGSNQ